MRRRFRQNAPRHPRFILSSVPRDSSQRVRPAIRVVAGAARGRGIIIIKHRYDYFVDDDGKIDGTLFRPDDGIIIGGRLVRLRALNKHDNTRREDTRKKESERKRLGGTRGASLLPSPYKLWCVVFALEL